MPCRYARHTWEAHGHCHAPTGGGEGGERVSGERRGVSEGRGLLLPILRFKDKVAPRFGIKESPPPPPPCG